MRLARRLHQPQGKLEVKLVDMHFSNTWHHVTNQELVFQEGDREEEGMEQKESVDEILEVEVEIEGIMNALSKINFPLFQTSTECLVV